MNERSTQQINELANALCHYKYKKISGVDKYLPYIINALKNLTDVEYTVLIGCLIKSTPTSRIAVNIGQPTHRVHTIYHRTVKKVINTAYTDAYNRIGKYSGTGIPDPELLALPVKALGLSNWTDIALTSSIGGGNTATIGDLKCQ